MSVPFLTSIQTHITCLSRLIAYGPEIAPTGLVLRTLAALAWVMP